MNWRKHDDKRAGKGLHKGKKRKRPETKDCETIANEFGCYQHRYDDALQYAMAHHMRGRRI